MQTLERFAPEKTIFLNCYNRNFKISKRGSTGLAYPLTKDEYTVLENKLQNLNIPYVFETEDGKCILEGDEQEPANSKVSFKISEFDTEFIIGNYNQAFILVRYADGIMKSLKRKGINARIEYFGPYSHIRTYQKQKQETTIQNKPIQEAFMPKTRQNIESESKQYKQMSIEPKGSFLYVQNNFNLFCILYCNLYYFII